MRDEEFINEVQARAGVGVPGDVDRVIRATLAVLGEQLPDSVAGPAAAALPEQLGEQLWGRRARSHTTAAQAGRLSRGIAHGEGSWPGDNTIADADIDGHPQVQKPPVSMQTGAGQTDARGLAHG
jgi:uncharacterized protein (DUF2267 family)